MPPTLSPTRAEESPCSWMIVASGVSKRDADSGAIRSTIRSIDFASGFLGGSARHRRRRSDDAGRGHRASIQIPSFVVQ